MEFEEWPDIKKLSEVVEITEKIDGSNAQVAIEVDAEGKATIMDSAAGLKKINKP